MVSNLLPHLIDVDIDTVQADMEDTFEISSLEKTKDFNPSNIGDGQTYCTKHTEDAKRGVGTFGFFVLTDSALQERTTIFFKVFKHKRKRDILFCRDPFGSTERENIFKLTFAGIVNMDIEATKTISLRSLIDCSMVESFGVGGKTCIMFRVYSSLPIGRDAHLFVFDNGAVDVKVLDFGLSKLAQQWMTLMPT
ncbi:beta-fructofuranosidase, cell wall isozyme-like [Curcuma longa]|uniref:beta-fructofuranosidase, cell wall isozyme-like n=1 Tax=Curcuma longa TaxID=136217 RepID=UPI003D9EFFDC